MKPMSVHGVLWLQTHFDSRHWDSIILGKVRLTSQNAMELSADAKKAKLKINCLNSCLSFSDLLSKTV